MWYKISIRFGPGHQGSETKYEWSLYELSEELKRELWESALDPWMEDCRGEVELVDNIPESVLKEKLDYYRGQEKYAKYMIELLSSSLSNCS